MKDLKVGDRVVVYGCFGRYIGVVTNICDYGLVGVSFQDGFSAVYDRKKLRLLTKKKRREFYIVVCGEDTYTFETKESANNFAISNIDELWEILHVREVVEKK